MCVSGFLLLLLSTGVHLSPHPGLHFGAEREDVRFYSSFSNVDDYVLYRICEDGELLLLINCTQLERPQPHGYEVRCVNSSIFYFQMSNLTMSHSGAYRAEGWRGGNITDHTNFHLTVCAEGFENVTNVRFGDSVELCSLDSPMGHGSSMQLYQYDFRLQNFSLVLDTNFSLEPLVEDLKGHLQVDLNTSLFTPSRAMSHDFGLLCTVWRGAQCQTYIYKALDMRPSVVFTHEGENVTLPCLAKEEQPEEVYWVTFTINQSHPQEVKYNQTPPQEVKFNQTHPQEAMYMLNRSQTGDYSLVIPSVSLQHSGAYGCRGGSDYLNDIGLFVCTRLSPLEVMFSPGQRVHLNSTNINTSEYGTQWLRQKVLQPHTLIVDFDSRYGKAHVSLPEDLRGRVTVSTSRYNSSLIISNLTAEDCGVYTWRAYGMQNISVLVCSEGSFHLVCLDLFGVHSPFYRAFAPLIGCGLLGLVFAVIWFKLRSRRGEQTSGRQRRGGQQRGDEVLYDEVEMAELNTPPSAVSDGAVEHSV